MGIVGAAASSLAFKTMPAVWGSGGGGLLSCTRAGQRDSGGDDSRLSDEDDTTVRQGNAEMTRSAGGNAGSGQRRGMSRGAGGEAGGRREGGGQTVVVGCDRTTSEMRGPSSRIRIG
jgi:hypothetical protein